MKLASIASYIIKSNSLPERQITFFRICLGFLGLLHALRFIEQGYPQSRAGYFFNLPLIVGINLIPIFLHKAIFGLLLALTILVIFDCFTSISLFCISVILIYIIISNFFAFQQDIFLGANLFFLLSVVMTSKCNTSQNSIYKSSTSVESQFRPYAIFAIKSLIFIVYLFAGINKINLDFFRGGVLKEVLTYSSIGNLLTRYIPYSSPILSAFTLIAELSVPFMLFMPSMRRVAFLLGTLLHLGISVIGHVGILFNFYMPVAYLLFCCNYSNSIEVVSKEESFVLIIPRGSILLNPIFILFFIRYIDLFVPALFGASPKVWFIMLPVFLLSALYCLKKNGFRINEYSQSIVAAKSGE